MITRLALALCALLVVGPLAVTSAQASPASPARRVSPGAVALGTAGSYAALGGTGVTSTGSTLLQGDLGLSPVGLISGFGLGLGAATGTTHDKDGAAATAQTDRLAAYNDAAGRLPDAPLPGDLIGLTFVPGVYNTGAALANSGIVTLDGLGDPTARFIFQIGGAFTAGAASSMNLINGATAANVIWQVAGAVMLSADVAYAGTFLAADAITLGARTTLRGRALSGAAVSFDDNVVTDPTLAPPVAAATTTVPLGAAAPFAVLAGTVVSNTGPSVINGDLGVSPGTTITGFPPGVVTGLIHPNDATAVSGQSARQSAYDNASTRIPTEPSFSGDQAGVTFGPGVHRTSAAFASTGVVTLDGGGNPNAVFIFQVNAAFSPALTGSIVLANGAAAGNIFWQVLGAVTLPMGASYPGTFIAQGAISLVMGSDVDGRLLSADAVTLDSSTVDVPATVPPDLTAPLVTIDGGASVTTADATPTISGTTDEPAGTTVTVTVAGQTLTTMVAIGGTWQVTAAQVGDATYTVTAQVTDPSLNTGTATQSLTVDAVPEPARFLAIDGGASRTTDDATPTISGTTSEPVGSVVTVTVEGQTLTASVLGGGRWSVTAAALADGPHDVRASVPPGYVATQTLTVTTVVTPAGFVAIDGGASRTTDDATPTISGTTSEAIGSTVTVSVGGQTLSTLVMAGNVWSVTAATLVDGVYQVTASVPGPGASSYTDTQSLTVASTPVEPDPVFRPDAAIRRAGEAYVGGDVYGGAMRQRVIAELGEQQARARFFVRLQNDGTARDRITVRGIRSHPAFHVVYRIGGRNVTRGVIAGTYRTVRLAPGASVKLSVTVIRTSRSRPGDHRIFRVRATSARNGQRRDVVAAVVRIPSAG